MKTICELNKCNGCMACVDKCPKQCISIKDDIYSYNAIKDLSICINCGLCSKVCPNINQIIKKQPLEWRQGWVEWNIRSKSSSGGVASSIIKTFIENGGYVASCLFENGQFIFEITNDLEFAKKFSGSKYVKSNPVGIYKKIEERLKSNKVLFIGLPCQVAGLKNYLRSEQNLYTIDLICHGTPSPQILNYYLEEKNIDINKIDTISFRNNISMGLKINNRRICSVGEDDYLLSFLDSLAYTENCYECKFASAERIADITLGDSWGSEFKDEEKNGISLVLIQTEKGKELCSSLELHEVNIEVAKKENHQLNYPSYKNPNRKLFISGLIEGKKFSELTKKIYKKEILKRYIKYVLVYLNIRKPLC